MATKKATETEQKESMLESTAVRKAAPSSILTKMCIRDRAFCRVQPDGTVQYFKTQGDTDLYG